jgi:hypothetical protein
MFELLVGRHLFNTEAKSRWTEKDDYLAQMLEMTNTLQYPIEVVTSAKSREEFFNESGCATIIYSLISRRFEADPWIKIYIIRKDTDKVECWFKRARYHRVCRFLAACDADKSC